MGGDLGQYEVVRRLDIRGFAQVELARDPAGEPCVLTMLKPGREADAAAFLHEARLLRRIEDPHVVAIVDVGEDPSMPYVVHELIDGVSLQELVRGLTKNGMSLPPRAVAEIGRSVARALSAVHGVSSGDGTPLGLIHGDVTPATIVCARDGVVKLADYGMSRQLLTASGNALNQLATLPGYRAPEARRQGARIDGRADLFGLGVILAELVSQQRIAEEAGGSLAGLQERVESVVAINLDVPEDLADLITEMCAVDPRERPRSADEVSQRLSSVVKSMPAKDALGPTLHDAFARHMPRAKLGSIPDVDTLPDDAIPEAETAIEMPPVPDIEPRTEPDLAPIDDDSLDLDTPPPQIAHGAMAQLELGADTAIWPSEDDGEDGPERLDSDFLVPVAALMPGDRGVRSAMPDPEEEPKLELAMPAPPKARLVQLKSDPFARSPVSAPPPLAGASLPPEPPSRRRFVLGVAAGALMVTGAVLASVLFGASKKRADSTPDPKAAASAAKRTGTLTVSSSPAGASIFIDGEATGQTTPAALKGMPLGRKLEVSVRQEGFVGVPDRASVFIPESAGAASVQFSLQEVRRYRLETVPSGATIRMGNAPLAGETPLRLPPIPIGDSVELVIERLGYEITTRTIVSAKDDPEVISVPLDREAALQIVSDPSGADVRLDGQLMGRAPVRFTIPKRGKFEVQIERPGYRTIKKVLRAGKVGPRLEVRLEEAELLSMPLDKDERRRARKLTQAMSRLNKAIKSSKRRVRRAQRRLDRADGGGHQFVHALAEAQRKLDVERDRLRKLEGEKAETSSELDLLRAQVLNRVDR